MKKYRTFQIANYFINKAKKDNIKDLTNLKLNNLAYISYGIGLAVDVKLFDENIVAWQHGFVIQSIYYQFSKYGKNPIEDSVIDFYDIENDSAEKIEDLNDKDSIVVLDFIWNNYKNYSGLDLRYKNNNENTPFDVINKVKGATKNLNHTIPDKVIKDYYTSLFKYIGI